MSNLTNIVQRGSLVAVSTRSSTGSDSQQQMRTYGRYYAEGPDAGAAASAGAPHGPDLQRPVPRIRVARTRGCDHGLAAARGHLRGTRCDPPGGGGAWSTARGREDLGRGQFAYGQGHEGAGGRGEGREGPSL